MGIPQSGIIDHQSYDNNEALEWRVNSNCSQIRVTSTLFDTEACCDFLSIEGVSYSGSDVVDQIVGNIFLVEFKSDGSQTATGFSLEWACTDPSGISTAV